MSGTIIIINGYPGVGKLSVACELAKQLPNSRILDLHHLDALASGIRPAESEGHKALITTMRTTLLSSLHPHPSNPITLLPLSLLTPSRNDLTSILSLASRKGLIVIHLILSCDTETNITRVLSRAQSSQQGKIMHESDIREIRMTDEVVRLMDGIIAKKLRANGHANGHANGNGDINGNDHHHADPMEALAGEFEIDTSRHDPGLTGMMGAECIMDAMRKKGVWLQIGVGRKASQ